MPARMTAVILVLLVLLSACGGSQEEDADPGVATAGQASDPADASSEEPSAEPPESDESQSQPSASTAASSETEVAPSESEVAPSEAEVAPSEAQAVPSGSEAAPSEATTGDGTVDGDAFTVTFPGAPEETTQDIDAGEGLTLPTTIYLYETADYALALSYVDYPAEVADADPAVVLQGAVDGSAQTVGGEIASTTPTEVQGNPAIQFVITLPQGVTLGTNVLVGNRLYQLNRAGPTDDREPFDDFAASFMLR